MLKIRRKWSICRQKLLHALLRRFDYYQIKIYKTRGAKRNQFHTGCAYVDYINGIKKTNNNNKKKKTVQI